MLFKKKNRREAKEPPQWIKKFITNVDEKLKQFSYFLTMKTNQVSKKRKRTALIIFCVALSSYSALVIIENLKVHEHFNRPTSIQFLPLQRMTVTRPFISEKEFKNIHHLKLVLDSLHLGIRQKTAVDDLLLQRPRLLDSVQYLEQLYKNQIKNKGYEK